MVIFLRIVGWLWITAILLTALFSIQSAIRLGQGIWMYYLLALAICTLPGFGLLALARWLQERATRLQNDLMGIGKGT